MSNEMSLQDELDNEYKMMGMPIKYFSILSIVLVIASIVDKLPMNLFGGILVCAMVGEWLKFIVEKVTIIKKTVGLAFVSIFAGILVYFSIIPTNMVEVASNTISGNTDFLAFYVGVLLCGSIMGMNRDLLIKAGTRYVIPVIGGILVSYGFAAIVGPLVGVSWKESIMYVAAPIMGGGNAAGAIPMSEIYASATGVSQEVVYSKIYPMTTFGNWISIFAAIVLNLVGKKIPKSTGNGILMEGFSTDDASKEYKYGMNFDDLATGLLVAGGFFVLGRIFSYFIPTIHAYAFSILAIAICKIIDIIPERIEYGSVIWYRFILKHFTVVIMGGVGLSLVNIAALIEALNFSYLVISAAVVLGTVLGAGFFGLFVNFYFVESAVTAGLCMSNAGGNGDIMVLSAADRMDLMAFAQISSRLGGGIVLVLQSILAVILL